MTPDEPEEKYRENAAPTVSVLVIEPHPAIRHGISRSLQQLGYHPVGVATAGEAEMALGLATVNVILIDHAVGNPNSLTTLRAMERAGKGRPAIVMSSRAHAGEVIDIHRAGAADFLVKPFTTRELDAALQRAMLLDLSRRVDQEKARGTLEPAYDMERDAVARPDPVELALSDLAENDLDLPLRPPLLREVQALSSKTSFRVNQVVDLITKDAALTGVVIQAANVGRFRSARPPTGLRQSCLRLGSHNVYVAVLGASLAAAFDVQGNPWRNVARKLVRQGAMTGRIAEALALREGQPDPEDFNLAGLFHNVGELVLVRRIARYAALEYAARPELSRVSTILSEYHERAGLPFVMAWELPAQIIDLCRDHHGEAVHSANPDLRRIVMAAWALTFEAGFSAFPEEAPAGIKEHQSRLDIEPRELRELVRDATRGGDPSAALAA